MHVAFIDSAGILRIGVEHSGGVAFLSTVDGEPRRCWERVEPDRMAVLRNLTALELLGLFSREKE